LECAFGVVGVGKIFDEQDLFNGNLFGKIKISHIIFKNNRLIIIIIIIIT